MALSLGLLPVGVTHHPALWSSDFPRLEKIEGATATLAHESHGTESGGLLKGQ